MVLRHQKTALVSASPDHSFFTTAPKAPLVRRSLHTLDATAQAPFSAPSKVRATTAESIGSL